MMQKEPPYDELIEVLRRDWQIEASWDGLRRFWYVGWTDEHVESCAECAKGLGAYADSLCDPLKAENAKLRELVRGLHWCKDFEQQKCYMCPLDGELYHRCDDIARELGIEVD